MKTKQLLNIGSFASLDKLCKLSIVEASTEENKNVCACLSINRTRVYMDAKQVAELSKALRKAEKEIYKQV